MSVSRQDAKKSAIRRRLVAADYPRRGDGPFFVDPEHNPLVVERCPSCEGRGGAYENGVYGRCSRCDGEGITGAVVRHFEQRAEVVRRAVADSDWLTCPWCNWRFSARDRSKWTGLRHLRCDRAIFLASGPDEPVEVPLDEPWHLVEADIWRDGGSYSATLAKRGRTVSLWLQVLPWDHPRRERHGALYVALGRSVEKIEHRVPPMVEAAWIDVLDRAERGALQCVGRASELAQILRSRIARARSRAGVSDENHE